MATHSNQIADLVDRRYKHGFVTDIEQDTVAPGLDEDVIRFADKIRRGIQERTVNAFSGPIHAPDHWWQDNLSLERGSEKLSLELTPGKLPLDVPAELPPAQTEPAQAPEPKPATWAAK